MGTHACTLLRGDGRCLGVLVAHEFHRKSLRACPFGASLRVKGQSLRAIPSREGTIPSREGTSLRCQGTVPWTSLERPFGDPVAFFRPHECWEWVIEGNTYEL